MHRHVDGEAMRRGHLQSMGSRHRRLPCASGRWKGRKRTTLALGVVVALAVGCGEVPTERGSSARMAKLPARSVVFASGDSLGVAVPSGDDIKFLSEAGETVGAVSVSGEILDIGVSSVGSAVWLEALACADRVVIDDTAGRVCVSGEQSVHLFSADDGAEFSSAWSTNLGSVDEVGALGLSGGPLVVESAAIVTVRYLRDSTERIVRVEVDGSATDVPPAPGADVVCAASDTLYAASRSMGADRTFMGFRSGRWQQVENLSIAPDAYNVQIGCTANDAVVVAASKDVWTVTRIDGESLNGRKAESFDGDGRLLSFGQAAAIVVRDFKSSPNAPRAAMVVVRPDGVTRHQIPDERVRRMMVEGATPLEGEVELYPRRVIDVTGRAVGVFIEADVNGEKPRTWETIDL